MVNLKLFYGFKTFIKGRHDLKKKTFKKTEIDRKVLTRKDLFLIGYFLDKEFSLEFNQNVVIIFFKRNLKKYV